MEEDPPMEHRTQKRFLMEIERQVRVTNQATIDPMIPPLKPDNLKAVTAMTARARGYYLRELFSIADSVTKGLPSAEQIKRLKYLRETYEEILSASQALSTAVERGYLDVKEE